MELHLRLYKAYVNDRAMEYGGSLWVSDLLKAKGFKAVWRKRTKRVVTRFFMHLEGIQASKFRHFPSAMSCWMNTSNKYSMYPCEYAPPEDRVMTPWEQNFCPWYMEFKNYNVYFNKTEKDTARILRDGKQPAPQPWSWKLVAGDDNAARLVEEKAFVDPVYDGKKARRELEIDRKPVKSEKGEMTRELSIDAQIPEDTREEKGTDILVWQSSPTCVVLLNKTMLFWYKSVQTARRGSPTCVKDV